METEDNPLGSLRPIVEVILQGLIVSVAISSMGLVTRWWYFGKSYPGDFLIYYNAALGDFRQLPAGNVWMYKEWIAYIFKPMLWTDVFRACMYWAGFQTICYMVLAHKLLEVKFGWAIVLITIPSFASLLKVGNIQISLCLAAIYPIPALLAGLVKPHHLVFAIILAFAARYRIKHESWEHLHKRR